MKHRLTQGFLVAVTFACGTFGTVEWSEKTDPLAGFISGDFPITTTTAKAGEARATVRRASCHVVRFYVARYGAPAAEAWARSKGATEAEIHIARRCIPSQQTAEALRRAAL